MSKETYSVYEAKARFSEILRKVERNKRVVITKHGTRVAEIIPVCEDQEDLASRLQRLHEEGLTSDCLGSPADIGGLVVKPGVLERFLRDRQD